MLCVVRLDCCKDFHVGFGAINSLLAATKEPQELFEQRFPSLNGNCRLYPRLKGIYRDLDSPGSVYLLVAEATEYDCAALRAIPGIAGSMMLRQKPEKIHRWCEIGPTTFRAESKTPDDGGG